MKHKLKKLLLEYGAKHELESHEAKKAFCDETEISYWKLNRWWNDPYIRISGEDLSTAAVFFNCSIDELFEFEETESAHKLTK